MKLLDGFILVIFMCVITGLASCGHIARDPAPASIDVGEKRVETVICNRWDVGENGCAFPKGELGEEKLKIFRVFEGSVSIVAQGCGIDKSFVYEQGGEWLEFSFRELIGKNSIDKECVLSIYQNIHFKGQDNAPIPVRGIYGTVTLGVCPEGVNCSFESEQKRVGWSIDKWEPKVPNSGTLYLRGCGQDVIVPTHYDAPFSLDAEKLWPNGQPSVGKEGCLFILSIKGDDGTKHKLYKKIWFFKEEAQGLAMPSLSESGKKLRFQGDKYASLSYVNGKPYYGNEGSFKPRPEGDFLRFYTVQGRSLVVFVKDGVILWKK